MDRHPDRTPAEWSDLIRHDPDKAADDMDAQAASDRAGGDKLGRLTAALREHAAGRLRERKSAGRGPPGTDLRRLCEERPELGSSSTALMSTLRAIRAASSWARFGRCATSPGTF